MIDSWFNKVRGEKLRSGESFWAGCFIFLACRTVNHPWRTTRPPPKTTITHQIPHTMTAFFWHFRHRTRTPIITRVTEDNMPPVYHIGDVLVWSPQPQPSASCARGDTVHGMPNPAVATSVEGNFAAANRDSVNSPHFFIHHMFLSKRAHPHGSRLPVLGAAGVAGSTSHPAVIIPLRCLRRLLFLSLRPYR